MTEETKEQEASTVLGGQNERLVMPRVTPRGHTLYLWTCAGCNFANVSAFLGGIPETIVCQSCRLEHVAA